MPSATVFQTGRETPRPEPLLLRAGPLSMRFEPDIAYLRTICHGEAEVIRAIYGAVRDEYWATAEPTVSNLTVEANDDNFTLRFDVHCVRNAVDFTWHGTITGTAEGVVTFAFEGVANAAFSRNRIGLCVLHPIEETAGYGCQVTHTDGSEEEGRFPLRIAPHQPFKDIRAITHRVAPGLAATVTFDGDVFEMEDQRNWTDASFKTYSTPLALPSPVMVEAGAKISQSVILSLGDAPEEEGQTPPAQIERAPLPPNGLPPLGLQFKQSEALTEKQASRLRALNLAHLRVDLRLSITSWLALLERATQTAAATGAKLEMVLHVSDAAAAELGQLRRAVDLLRPPVARWLVLHDGDPSTTDDQWVHRARLALGAYDKDALFGGGTNKNFTEMNRNPPPAQFLDFLAFPINPQVHAFDDTSVMENLEAQAHTILSAPGADEPLIVSPVTLEKAGADDLRQASLLCAAWTVGSLAQLTPYQRVSAITFYEAAGPQGVLDAERVFPVYHVFADLGESPGRWVRPLPPVRGAVPASVTGLLLSEGLLSGGEGRQRLLVANKTLVSQEVEMAVTGGTAAVRMLDETSVARATNDPEAWRAEAVPALPLTGGSLPLTLRPYAVARVDIEGKSAE